MVIRWPSYPKLCVSQGTPLIFLILPPLRYCMEDPLPSFLTSSLKFLQSMTTRRCWRQNRVSMRYKSKYGQIATKSESAPSFNPHCFKPGDKVWIKRDNHLNFEPLLKGPHKVILMMPIARKVNRIQTWIYHSYVKPSRQETTPQLKHCRELLPEYQAPQANTIL